ncbi:MAG TPA: Hpt domain-containing protein, partial [Stellaceae bacterium]|nr:Hpt domain-containing protein [Stellaceae bacterium]
MDDLLSDFLTETNESLSVLDLELVKLERNPNDPELLGNIFRLVHTIKGTCGFLDLPRLEKLAHAGENVLGKIREGALAVTPRAVSLILECLDGIKFILAALEATEAEPAGGDADLIGRLNALGNGGGSAKAAKPKAKPAAKDAVPPPAPSEPKESALAAQSIRVNVDLLE